MSQPTRDDVEQLIDYMKGRYIVLCAHHYKKRELRDAAKNLADNVNLVLSLLDAKEAAERALLRYGQCEPSCARPALHRSFPSTYPGEWQRCTCGWSTHRATLVDRYGEQG